MIYVLRHEERLRGDNTFHVELTKTGRANAEKLSKTLEGLGITHVFSSPFIRTLQTIRPFLLNSKLDVNAEWSLSEAIRHVSFEVKPDMGLSLQEMEYYHICLNYESIWSKDDLVYKESRKAVKKRVMKFAESLLEKHQGEMGSILICGHLAICNYLMKGFGIKRKRGDEFPMGRLIGIDPHSKQWDIIENGCIYGSKSLLSKEIENIVISYL